MSNVPPRTYGFWTGVFVVAASMVGSGILGTSGTTLRDTGSPAALLILWIIGGFMALAGALTVAELGSALPKAGGDYVFVREAFGNAVGFVFGWCNLLFTFAGPVAWIALLTVDYISPNKLDAAESAAWATGIIAVFTIVHCIGQRESGWVQNLTTIVKLAIFVAFAIFGFASGGGSFSHFSQGGSAVENLGWVGLAVNLTYVLYAYSGWNGAAYLAGEIRDPERNLPRSLIVGSLTVTVLYLLINAVYVYAIPMSELQDPANKDKVSTIAAFAGERLFGENISRTLSVIFGIGMLATVSALLFTAPRIAFMMSRDHLMPAPIGWLHPTRQTPTFAVMLVGVLSAAIVWSGSSGQILDFTAVGLTAMSALTVGSIFPLRLRTDLPRRYRVPLFPLPPIFFLLLTAMTVALVIRESKVVTIGMGEWTFEANMGQLSLLSVLLGFPVYFVYMAIQKLWNGPDNGARPSNDDRET